MNNILEEYLVKIGAEFDTHSFNSAMQGINRLSGAMGRLGGLLTYGGVIAGLAKLADTIVSNIKSVAMLDLQYQKLAKDMWVTKDTAKSLKMAMEIMGASEDDIAWIPELREQFFRLREEMQAFSTPEDAGSQLRWIRDIGYDIESLQLKFKMFREWLVYYLIKYLEPYIQKFRQFVQWLNAEFGERLPELARKLASWLSGIVSVIVSAGRAIGYVFGKVYDFIDNLPGKTKALVAAMAAAGVVIMAGPFGMMLTAIGGALLLLEDFFYYLDGRKSSKTLAPMWKMLVEMGQSDGIFGRMGAALQSVFEGLSKIVNEIDFSKLRDNGIGAFSDLLKGLNDLIKGLADLSRRFKITGLDSNAFFRTLGRLLESCINNINIFTRLVGKLLSALGEAFKGNMARAGSMALDAISEAYEAKKEGWKKVLKPDSNNKDAGKAGENRRRVQNNTADDTGTTGERRKVQVEEGIFDKDLAGTKPRLKDTLEAANAEYYARTGKDFLVTSGYRSEEYNASVNGSPTSHHLTGDAVDISTVDMSDEEFTTAREILHKYGLNLSDDDYHDRGSGYHFHATTPPADFQLPEAAPTPEMKLPKPDVDDSDVALDKVKLPKPDVDDSEVILDPVKLPNFDIDDTALPDDIEVSAPDVDYSAVSFDTIELPKPDIDDSAVSFNTIELPKPDVDDTAVALDTIKLPEPDIDYSALAFNAEPVAPIIEPGSYADTYTPQSFASSFVNNTDYSSVNNNTNVNMGGIGITVNVKETNAKPKDIAAEVSSAFENKVAGILAANTKGRFIA